VDACERVVSIYESVVLFTNNQFHQVQQFFNVNKTSLHVSTGVCNHQKNFLFSVGHLLIMADTNRSM
jgi:hypothetical protein